MQTAASARLLGILLTGILLLAPGLACATVYKCVENNQTTYSSQPCGKNAQEVNAPLSVTPPFEPPEPLPDRKSGFLDKLGLSGSTGALALLLALIPAFFVLMFMPSRKSPRAK